MRRSLNEIEVTLRKAAVGAGVPWGFAEELARAGTWLCARGGNGVGALLQALADPPAARQDISTVDGVMTIADAHVAFVGPSALDLALSRGPGTLIRLTNVDAPALFAALIGTRGIAARLTGSNGATAQIGGSVLDPALWLLPPGGDILATLIDVAASKGVEPCMEGADVDGDAWADAERLAARTYVAASVASRERGAGAGLSDND